MVKSGRPVIVLSPVLPGRSQLVTVVALSSVRPDPIQPYHLQLPRNCLPQIGVFEKESWLKGDMIYSVGFHRLELIRLGKRNPATGKRLYFSNRLGRDTMRAIYSCVLHGLNMGMLAKHL